MIDPYTREEIETKREELRPQQHDDPTYIPDVHNVCGGCGESNTKWMGFIPLTPYEARR